MFHTVKIETKFTTILVYLNLYNNTCVALSLESFHKCFLSAMAEEARSSNVLNYRTYLLVVYADCYAERLRSTRFCFDTKCLFYIDT